MNLSPGKASPAIPAAAAPDGGPPAWRRAGARLGLAAMR